MSTGNTEKYDYKLKIIVLGESKVGKTSLICRYSKDEFATSYLSTVGVDFQIKKIQVDDKAIKLQIWDTAGQERFRTITRNFFNSTHGFIVCYDITSKDSFQCVTLWLNEIKKNSGDEDVQIILIGNKSDLDDERQVTTEQGQNFANNHKIPFFETSAKEGTNLNEVFETLSRNIIEVLKKKKPIEEKERTSFSLNPEKTKPVEEKRNCC